MPAADDPAPRDTPDSPEAVTKREFATLEQELAAVKRELARQRRPFVVRVGERVVAGLIVAFIVRVAWDYTPVGDHAARLVVEGLRVVVDGATYVLPYVPLHPQ